MVKIQYASVNILWHEETSHLSNTTRLWPQCLFLDLNLSIVPTAKFIRGGLK